ncbi:MAG: phosphodiester glycosidase family protein [Cyanosarcina radialis HA8281-LM2]|nr:phosphodiester glycosidase family protein [Cyanosarcina radialis HA8281-LM2]
MTIHIVTIDLNTPGIKVLVTPGKLTSDRTATKARTTSEFLREFKLQLAINANFFHPFRENTPWDYYPRSGDRVGVIGQAIGNGDRYAPIKRNWPVLCFQSNNRAQILPHGDCPQDTVQAIAGSNLLVDQGKAIVPNPNEPDKPYARVPVGINRQGDKLWLVLVDGKQPFYSEGIKEVELVKMLEELGVYTAVNLDGGGSTTLVMATGSEPKLLNAPIHTKLPMRERPVANHLGFYIKQQEVPR